MILSHGRAMQPHEKAVERPGLKSAQRSAALAAALTQGRDLFRAVPARYTTDRPLIGVVGERPARKPLRSLTSPSFVP